MKKTLLALLCCSAILGSCTKATEKTCAPVLVKAPASEVAALQAYITSRGITAVADTLGFFYTISKQGSDIKPTPCSNVTAAYTLRLSNGSQVQASNGASFNLGGTIVGWQEAIPLIGEGGMMTLYLPPSLGYGAAGRPPEIPGNSILVFDIELLDVM